MTEIKQIDRDAGAAFVRLAWHLFWPNDYNQAMQDARGMQKGLCDNWSLVQAFATHRTTAEAEVESYREALKAIADDSSHQRFAEDDDSDYFLRWIRSLRET